jgi:hypothetical protein
LLHPDRAAVEKPAVMTALKDKRNRLRDEPHMREADTRFCWRVRKAALKKRLRVH